MNDNMMEIGGVPNVQAIVENTKTGVRRIYTGNNIITNNGDLYYATKAVGGTPWTVAGLRLGVAAVAPTKTSTDVGTALAAGSVATDATYPMISDSDGDNSAYASADSVTWRFSFGTGLANGTVSEGAIVDSLTAASTALCHFLFGTAFAKTSADTLKVFVNHNFLGS